LWVNFRVSADSRDFSLIDSHRLGSCPGVCDFLGADATYSSGHDFPTRNPGPVSGNVFTLGANPVN